MTKVQIIRAIQELNHSAHQDWLGLFDTVALRKYLDHLQITLEPRGGRSVWTRPGDTRAVVTRHPQM